MVKGRKGFPVDGHVDFVIALGFELDVCDHRVCSLLQELEEADGGERDAIEQELEEAGCPEQFTLALESSNSGISITAVGSDPENAPAADGSYSVTFDSSAPNAELGAELLLEIDELLIATSTARPRCPT